jgi:hypothetical protein
LQAKLNFVSRLSDPKTLGFSPFRKFLAPLQTKFPLFVFKPVQAEAACMCFLFILQHR